MFGDIGAPELLIILAIVVVLFGATRVAQIGSGLGRGIREFRRELKGSEDDKPKAESEAQVAQSSSTPEPSRDQTVVTTSSDKSRFLH